MFGRYTPTTGRDLNTKIDAAGKNTIVIKTTLKVNSDN